MSDKFKIQASLTTEKTPTEEEGGPSVDLDAVEKKNILAPSRSL
jgi:hypothetical protein